MNADAEYLHLPAVLTQPAPEPPSADVIPFPTATERMHRESQKWLRTWTRPFDGGAA